MSITSPTHTLISTSPVAVEDTSRPIRTVLARALALLAFMALGILVPAPTPATASTVESLRKAYTYQHTDSFAFWAGNKVYAQGSLDWYKDGWLAPVYRGQIRNDRGSYVTLQANGCLHIKVTWRKVSGSVSWPPSGTVSTTSDGWYVKCGAARSTYMWLGGIAHASHALFGATICTGYSYSRADVRRFDACWRMSN